MLIAYWQPKCKYCELDKPALDMLKKAGVDVRRIRTVNMLVKTPFYVYIDENNEVHSTHSLNSLPILG